MGNATLKPGILEVGSGIGFAIDGTPGGWKPVDRVGHLPEDD